MVSIAPSPRLSFAPARRRGFEIAAQQAAFPRLMAPIFCTPARFRLIPLGKAHGRPRGVTIYSDEAFSAGEYTHAEIALPDGNAIHCLARVAWVSELGEGDPARYDVGVELFRLRPEDSAALPLARG